MIHQPAIYMGSVKFGNDQAFQLEVRRRVDDYFRVSGRRQRDCWQMYVKTAVIVASFAISYVWLVFVAEVWWHGTLLAMLLGLSAAGIGFNIQHDGGHEAYSRFPWVNKLMAMTLEMIGGSSYLWRWKHVVFHHSGQELRRGEGIFPEASGNVPDARDLLSVDPRERGSCGNVGSSFLIIPLRIASGYRLGALEEIRASLERALAALQPKEAQVIRRRFGVSVETPQTLNEIGAVFLADQGLEAAASQKMRLARALELCRALPEGRGHSFRSGE